MPRSCAIDHRHPLYKRAPSVMHHPQQLLAAQGTLLPLHPMSAFQRQAAEEPPPPRLHVSSPAGHARHIQIFVDIHSTLCRSLPECTFAGLKLLPIEQGAIAQSSNLACNFELRAGFAARMVPLPAGLVPEQSSGLCPPPPKSAHGSTRHTWPVVSLSRRVTVPSFSTVSPSTVMSYGTPSSSVREYRLPIVVPAQPRMSASDLALAGLSGQCGALY